MPNFPHSAANDRVKLMTAPFEVLYAIVLCPGGFPPNPEINRISIHFVVRFFYGNMCGPTLNRCNIDYFSRPIGYHTFVGNVL